MKKTIDQRIKALERNTRAKLELKPGDSVILYESELEREGDPRSARIIRIVSRQGDVLAERKQNESKDEFVDRYFDEKGVRPPEFCIFIPHNRRDNSLQQAQAS